MQDKQSVARPVPPFESLFTTGNRVLNPVNISVLLMVAFSWLSFFDQKTIDFIDSSLLQSVAAFATAKGLNGAIGVLESANISISLLGEASFDIGKILAPAKELIDQFAEVMEYAIGSLILQKLLITISSSTFFKILLTVIGALFLLFHLLRYRYQEFYRHYRLVYKLFVSVLFARFFFLLVFGVGTALDSAFISQPTDEKIAAIEGTPAEIDPTGNMTPEEKAEREQLSQQLQRATERLSEEQKALLTTRNQVAALQEEIQGNQQKRDQLDQQLNLKERYFGSDDSKQQALYEQRQELTKELEIAEEFLAQAEAKQKRQQRNLDALNQQIEQLETAIENFGKSTLGMVRALGVDFIKSAKDKLETAANTALELTVLFLFKAVLMPLLFIYAGYKLFLRVWNYDVRELRQTDWREAMGEKNRPSDKDNDPVLPAP